MIIDCISDLHGFYPDLEGGDLLIVAGDFCNDAQCSAEQLEFLSWLQNQKYTKSIFVAGNHDIWLERVKHNFDKLTGIEYLCDSGTEFEGLKIWGSPWTKTFPGMNPHCKAFTVDTEEELAEKWGLIPGGLDILITHSPVYGIMDVTRDGRNAGSSSLGTFLLQQAYKAPLLHICGHIHEGYGFKTAFPTQFINASHVNERYEPINKPMRIEL